MISAAVPRTIFARLLLVFLLFGLVMTAVFLFVNRVAHEHYHRELAQTTNRGLAQHYVDADFLLIDQPLTVVTLHRGIGKLAAANPDVDIYLVDPRGGLVASSVPEAAWARRTIDVKPIEAFLSGSSLPLMGDDPADRSRREVFSAAPVDIEGCPARYLYILLRRGQRLPPAGRLSALYSLTEGAGVLGLASLLAVGLSIWFLRILTRRLSVLDNAMHEFETSNGEKLPVPRQNPGHGDEIDRLERSFFELARRSQQHVEALHATDEMRRQLLANVSHDLLTPLTTLVTHLEAVSTNHAHLSSAEQDSYLEVALKQARRVIHLVQQILEAAKLEAGQVHIHPEPFPIAELLQDVVQKFRLNARERDVELELRASSQRAWVNADITLLERALDNLLENALRYAPPGTAVVVDLAEQGTNVRVSISDAGEGLAPEDVERVFDRFYRRDKGRSSPPGHAGLGLAIVQGILRLHGTSVSVASRRGQGSTFAFELPLYAASASSSSSEPSVTSNY
jgi:two-component system, OmpR family, sensor kinase